MKTLERHINISILFFLISLVSFSQVKSEYELKIHKYHKGILNDIVINEELNEIISADSYGNILVHDASNYRYIRSLNTHKRESVFSIRLINNNKDLLINYYNKDTKKGELCFYNLGMNIIYKTFSGNYKTTNPNGESLIAIAKDDVKLLLYNKSPFKKIDSIVVNKPILTSTISFNDKNIATLEEVNINPGTKSIKDNEEIKTLNFYDLELKKKIHNIKFNDKTKIPSAIIFEKESLIVLTSNQQRNDSELNRINLIDYKVNKIDNNNFYTSSANTKIISTDRNNILVINDGKNKNYSSKSCIGLNLQESIYSINEIKINFISSIGIFNNLKKEYVFFSGQNYFQINGEINVLDLAYNKLEKNPFVIDYVKSKSLFLSNDNWVSFNTTKTINKVFNYYKRGELSNIFLKKEKQSSSFFKTLDENFNIHYQGLNENLVDREKNIIGYSSLNSISKEPFYYSYNLLNNSKQKICRKNKGENALAFNAKVNAFIVEYNKKDEFNYKTNSKLKVIDKQLSIDIDTTLNVHHKVKFSNSGKYICLVKEKSIEILDWKIKKQLLIHNFNFESYYSKNVFQISKNDFIVSGREENSNKSVYFKITEDKGTFKISEQNKGLVLSADFKNNQLALLFSDGIVFNGNNYKTKNYYDLATSISLNSNASKMLVNFSNGKTKLLETKTFNWLNTIINFPNNKSLIYNTKGKYYSNFEGVNDYLFLTKNNKRFSLDIFGTSLYDPISILSDFGFIEDKIKIKIAEALRIRNELKKELVEKNNLISDFYIVDNKASLKTNKLKNKIQILLSKDLKYDFVIKINNVVQKNLNIKKVNPKIYETEINLSQKINVIEIVCLNSTEKSSPKIKEILYEYVIPRNLYLMSVGVSNYKDNNYKLNYAHKDALDLSLRYGDVDKKSITNYLNKIYPLSIAKVEFNKKTDTILGNINSVFNFFERSSSYTYQLSKNGNYWIAPVYDNNNDSDRVKAINLYDFTTNTVNKIDLRKWISLDSETRTFQGHSNNTGFYYSSIGYNEYEEPINEVYFYDYKTKETIKTNIPFNTNISYPINDYDWLTTNEPLYEFSNSEDEEETKLCIVKNTKINGTWDKKIYVLNIELIDFVSILDVNDDGSKVLIEHYIEGEHNYSLFKLEKGNYTKTRIDFGTYVEEVFISKDNSKILAFDKNDEQLNLITYSILNNRINHKKTTISSFNDQQLIGNNYGEPLYLEPIPKEKKDVLFEKRKSINHFLSTLKAKPFSFNKTYIKTLTNEEATSKNILHLANSFFKDAKAEDQIILFLAGHGVLNKKLDYYYAPQDMDFTNPDEKGISYSKIVNILSDSPAIQKLLITDTCHSGNTFDIANNDIKEEKSKLGQRGTITKSNTNLKDIKTSSIISSIFDNFFSKNGITVLSASSGQEVAYEFKNIYNGAFTSVYLKALETHINKQTTKNFNFKYSLHKDKHFDIIIGDMETLLLSLTKSKQKMEMREINKLAKTILW